MRLGITRHHSCPVYLLSTNNTSGIGTNALNYLFTSEIASKIGDVQTKQQRQFSQLLQSVQEQQPQKHSTNILVIDDEPDTLFTYESFLSDEGYSVKTFSDPQEALEHFFQLPDPSHYKLALLDIRMPKLNGLQLFHKMKALSPKIKIMFCSALDVAQEVTGVLPDIEHEHFMRKPVEREHFINKINSALDKR
ncbi:MAG TPA: response regulator [Nitrososphaeraceae archaeon]|nr:response regulator [Nitrososphaeraceae archaeon]